MNPNRNLNNPLTNPVQHLSTSLDLSGQPAGNYYFNQENNYNYSKNWFNYNRFHIISNDTVINEVVQGSHPDLITSNLDLSNTYQLSSTHLTPDSSWVYTAKIERGYSGFSGVDAVGNTYVLANYNIPSDADIYNSNNVYVQSSPSVGVITLCLTCYNSMGSVIWVSRIEPNTTEEYVEGFYCVTDDQGKTFILGTSNGTVIFRDASGNSRFTVNISGKNFIVAYNSDGTPDWVTFFLSGTSKGYLIVDKQQVENVYAVISNPYGISEFYDGVPINSTLMMTVPPANLILAKFRTTSGLFQWATFLNGYRLDTLKDYNHFSNQSGICDSFGNIFLTGYYTQMNPLIKAATPSDSSIETVWIPYESDRNWSAVDLNLDGSLIVATVENDSIYICRNKQFETWEPVTEARNWSSVYCNNIGDLIVATEYEGKIYQSTDYGETWNATTGEGNNSRPWVSIAGSLTGDKLVAVCKDDRIYYSSSIFSTRGINGNWNGSLWVAVGEGTNTIGTSPNGINWTGQGMNIFSISGNAVEWNTSLWVAVGEGINTIATSPNGINWTGLGTSVFSVSGNGVTRDTGLWVAVGEGTNTIATSPDGTNWTGLGTSVFSISGNGVDWAIIYTTVWVAVGEGTNTIATSLDGTNWSGLGTSLFSISGNEVVKDEYGLWIAVGEGTNTIATSPDGLNWTGLGTGVFSISGNGVGWDEYGLRVAVGEGTNTIATSPDGTNWTGLGTSMFSISGNGVAWSDYGLWVAVGEGTNTIATSPDGTNWTGIEKDIFSIGNTAVWNGDDLWVAVGTGTNTIATSSDGITWTGLGTSIFSISGNGIAYDSFFEEWVAVGEGMNTVATSLDGINWTGLGTSVFSIRGNGVYFDSFIGWIAVGEGTNTIAISSDRINWTGLGTSVFSISGNGVAYDYFLGGVAVGEGINTIATSLDGINWTGLGTNIFSIRGNGVAWDYYYGWVIVGEGTNTIATSLDGTNWTGLGTSVFSISGNGVAYDENNNVWVAFGEGTYQIAYSTDGINWIGVQTSIFSTRGNDVYWNETLWVAVGEGTNTITTSPNGTNWTGLGTSVFSVSGNGVAWNTSLWVAVGEGTNTIATSLDGINWTGLGTSVFSIRGNGITWNNNLWVAIGEGTNTIATSPDGINWVGQDIGVFSTSWNGIVLDTTSDHLCIAVGEGTNTIATSSDGIIWTNQGMSIFSVQGNGVAWNTNLIIAVGKGTNTIATSPDGINWTGLGTSVFSISGNGVAWNGALWVAVGEGTNTIATSPDGINWTGLGTGVFSIAGYGIAWSVELSRWVAFGKGTNEIVYSSDGIEWKTISSNDWVVSSSIIADWVDVAYDASTDTFMALVKNGQAYFSNDNGATWTLSVASPVANWSAITGSRIATSPSYNFFATVENGKIYGLDHFGNWTLLDTSNRNWSDIAISSGLGIYTNLFATVYNGEIYQSKYSSNTVWNSTTTTNQNWNRIAVSQGNLAVATVQGGKIYISTTLYTYFETSSITVPPYSNPVVWTPRETNRNWSATDLNQQGDIMVATVENGYIYVSRDYGTTWDQTATVQNWSGVYCNFTGEIMIGIVYDSVIYRSIDYGYTWVITGGEGSNAKHWNAVAGTALGNQLVAITINDKIYYSSDFGSNWNISNSNIAEWIDVSYDENNNLFIALVRNGGAYFSINGGINWDLITSSPIQNWSAIAGSRYASYPDIIKYPFLTTVKNGRIYGVQVRKSEPQTMINDTTPSGYIANASTILYESGNDAYKSFDNNYNTFWESDIAYNGNSGTYIGFSETIVDGDSIFGEWIQIKLPTFIILKEFFIIPVNSFPKDFIIVGSNDETNWIQLCSFVNQNSFNYKTFIISSPILTSFNYFRLIIKKLGGVGTSDSSVSIIQWNLNFDFVWNEIENINRDWTDIAVGTGTGEYSSIFAGVYDGSMFQTIYDSEIWTPTTTPYNWNTVSMSLGNISIATVKGGQIYISQDFYPRRHTFLVKYNSDGVPQWANYVNCPTTNEADNMGMSLGVQSSGDIILSGMIINNNGGSVECFSPSDYINPIKSLNFNSNIPPTLINNKTPIGYEASASTTYSDLYLPYKAFDNDSNTFWHSNINYDEWTGEYIGSTSTLVNGNLVFGEWLQIKLRESYVLTHFSITPRNILSGFRSPENFIVVGSNDSINWVQLCIFTGQVYYAYNQKYFVISNPIQTAFLYFRLITTVAGGGGDNIIGLRDSIQITQWTFEGNGTIQNADRFLVCYSNDGLPLWINQIQMQTGSGLAQIKSITTDTLNNIYCFGYCAIASFYNPTGQNIYTDNINLPSDFFSDISTTAILVKYYPDGSFQSCARLISLNGGSCYGNSIRVINNEIYLSGYANTITYDEYPPFLYAAPSNYFYAPDLVNVTRYNNPGIFIMKYLSVDFYSPFVFPSPGYPEVLQTHLTIGGSIRKFVNGYVYDGPVEAWGGQTGFLTGSITPKDVNTGVIVHMGHQRYLNDNYKYLTLKLSEPSFPTNDPQPVTPGTIPYGFLPIYISVPKSTISLMFNTYYMNNIYSNVNARLDAIGSELEIGASFSGISVGDHIRLLIRTTDNIQYITLTVKGFVISTTNIPAALVFEEPTSYVQTVIGGIESSSSMLITKSIFQLINIPNVDPSISSYDFSNQQLTCPNATFQTTISVGDYVYVCIEYYNYGETFCFTSIVEQVISDTELQLKFIIGEGNAYPYEEQTVLRIEHVITTPKKYLSAFIQPVLIRSGTLQVGMETILMDHN